MADIFLLDLPTEVLRSILAFLDVSSLLQTSRTSHLLRALCLDPLLQKARLDQARHDLKICLLYRQPKSAISPPNAWIWLSKTNVLSRSISKSLIRIRLNHSLERRPSAEQLVEKAILPECCLRIRTAMVSPVIVRTQEEVRKSRLKDRLGTLLEHRPSVEKVVELNILPAECAAGSVISFNLMETRRRIVKEHLKDGLRSWLKRTALEEQRRKEEAFDVCSDNISVKAAIRRLTARRAAAELEAGTDRVSLDRKRARARWGKQAQMEKLREERRHTAFGACSQPTRAHVLGLKHFWEGITKVATDQGLAGEHNL